MYCLTRERYIGGGGAVNLSFASAAGRVEYDRTGRNGRTVLGSSLLSDGFVGAKIPVDVYGVRGVVGEQADLGDAREGEGKVEGERVGQAEMGERMCRTGSAGCGCSLRAGEVSSSASEEDAESARRISRVARLLQALTISRRRNSGLRS